MNVSKSGYFSKMIQEHDGDDSSIPDTPIKDKEEKEENDDILSMPSSIESKDTTPKVDATEEDEGTPKLAERSTNEDEKQESNQGEHHEDEGEDEDESISKSIASSKEENHTEDENDTHASEEKNNDSPKLDKSRQSVNLGKWKPDTEALRSGFVQETAKKAPPGFVYDETGNLIDLTPSSMKGRAVSTYSGIESGWNAFPADEDGTGGDLETIKDARTIYDNNTIYNVPGLIGRNTSNLPPLPSNIDTTDKPSQGPRLRSISNPISNSDKRIEGPGIHQPNSQEIAKINQNNTIPQLDLNKLISGNISYNAKYEQLTDYYKELGDYDSGIQTWISYILKSSTKEKEFLFQEYKDNRHVREAYANAEDLTKKNTVINTVNTVNQNVNHLKKKVFSHTMNSMKPKMLFSSIGKKKL